MAEQKIKPLPKQALLLPLCAFSSMMQEMKKSSLLTIFFVVFFDLLAFGIVIPILPYYSHSFGATGLQLGWLMAVYSLAQFIFSPLWGSLSDRIGRRPVLLGTIFLGALMMLLTAFAQSYETLLLARLLAGVFAANISTASAYIADITSEENRAKGMGIIGAGYGLGFIFGPALGGFLSTHGYSLPILCAAGLGFANFVFALFVLPEPPREGKVAVRSRWVGWTQALANPRTRWPITLFSLHTLAFTQLEVVFALFMLARFGLQAQSAGFFLAGMGVVSAILQGGLIGRLARRYGEGSLIPVAFFFFFVSIIAAAYAPTPLLFGICLIGVAIGMGIGSPSLSSLASKGADPSSRGSVMGIYQSGGSLARVVGPVIAGFFFDRFGHGSPFVASGVLMGFGFLLALRARRSLA